MPKRKEPLLLNMRRSGLSLGFSIQGRKMTGLNVDYQEGAASGEISQVVGMIDGVMSGRERSQESTSGALLEGIARLDSGWKQPKGKDTTLVNLQASGLKMGMVLRERRVTGLNIDFQDVSGSGEVRELLRVLNLIASGEVYRKAHIVTPALKDFVGVLPERAGPAGESRKTPRRKPGDDVIVKAVDASLDILGAEGKQAFLGLLESKYGMKLGDIPARPRGFAGLLKANLGPTGDEVEREIVREIRQAAPVMGTSLEEVVESLKSLGSGQEKGEPEKENSTGGTTDAQETGPDTLDGVPPLSMNFNVDGDAKARDSAESEGTSAAEQDATQ